MRRAKIIAFVMFAFMCCLPVLGWWLLACDTQPTGLAAEASESEPANLPKPKLDVPPRREFDVQTLHDPIRALDSEAFQNDTSAFKSIVLPDGFVENVIDGKKRSVLRPESRQVLHDDSGRNSDWSYNPELRRLGYRIGSDGQPKRIAGDGEIPATWEDLRRAQGLDGGPREVTIVKDYVPSKR